VPRAEARDREGARREGRGACRGGRRVGCGWRTSSSLSRTRQDDDVGLKRRRVRVASRN